MQEKVPSQPPRCKLASKQDTPDRYPSCLPVPVLTLRVKTTYCIPETLDVRVNAKTREGGVVFSVCVNLFLRSCLWTKIL